MDAVDAIMRAFVPDTMDLRRIGKHARFAVAADRVILPTAFPELVDGGEKILRRVVAFVMDASGGQTHPARTTVEIAGHDVPADPSFGEMIERREAAGELIRMLECQ